MWTDNNMKQSSMGSNWGQVRSNIIFIIVNPQDKIQEYKEAFGMIDANRDGFIDKDDLR